MSAWTYTKGLHQVGTNTHAYLIPDGDWGWSNSGLVEDSGQTLLVDTLFDLKLTGEMLDCMADAVPAAAKIGILVNSHADADHTFGNQLVSGARIITSQAAANEFYKVLPSQIHQIVVNADALGEGGRYIAEKMGRDRFDFSNITLTGPSETFDRNLCVKVGNKEVNLHNVGPAHTAGDTLVHVIQDRVVFTGDLIFMGVHPAIWDGAIEGWISACDTILAMDIDVVVPGHGPITDKAGVRTFREYLVMFKDATRARFDAGLSVLDAALDIVLSPPFNEWKSPERIAGNVNFLYRSFGGNEMASNQLELFALMSRYVGRKSECSAGKHTPGCGHNHLQAGT
jgi:cyclase